MNQFLKCSLKLRNKLKTEMDLPKDYTKLNTKTRKEVREEYIKRQENKCMFCHTSLDENPDSSITNKKINWKLFPIGFMKNPIHLQHCHKSGLTEGAVHAYCNAVMWCYEGR